MNKKLKIAYWVVMALNAIVFVVDIITANFFEAILPGFSIIWLFICYRLAKTICEQDSLIEKLLKLLKDDASTIDECLKREKIHHQEFAKMRERAESAEKQLQQMIDDTPARGKDGRYIKRENE